MWGGRMAPPPLCVLMLSYLPPFLLLIQYVKGEGGTRTLLEHLTDDAIFRAFPSI